jgi:hypothetical protein
MTGIPLSASAIERWRPIGYGDSAPEFLIKPASLIERAEFRRAVAAHGCRFPTQAEIFAILRGLLKDYGDDHAAPFLTAIDLLEAAEQTPLAADDADAAAGLAEATAALDQLERSLMGFANPYAAALADREHFLAVAPVLAIQRFCLGWEGEIEGETLPAFRRHGNLIPMDLVEELPAALRLQLGFRCLDYVSLSSKARKN